MKSQHFLRMSLTYALLGSGVAVALLLAVLFKAAAYGKLALYPGRAALICLFLVAFAAFGIADVLVYRRLARTKSLRAGKEDG